MWQYRMRLPNEWDELDIDAAFYGVQVPPPSSDVFEYWMKLRPRIRSNAFTTTRVDQDTRKTSSYLWSLLPWRIRLKERGITDTVWCQRDGKLVRIFWKSEASGAFHNPNLGAFITWIWFIFVYNRLIQSKLYTVFWSSACAEYCFSCNDLQCSSSLKVCYCLQLEDGWRLFVFRLWYSVSCAWW